MCLCLFDYRVSGTCRALAPWVYLAGFGRWPCAAFVFRKKRTHPEAGWVRREDFVLRSVACIVQEKTAAPVGAAVLPWNVSSLWGINEVDGNCDTVSD